MTSSDLEIQAEQELEISPRTLRRAKKALQVASLKQGSGWAWQLPSLSLLSPPTTTLPGSLDSLGQLGTLGQLGHLQHLQHLGGISVQDDQVGQIGQASQDGQVDQVQYARTHEEYPSSDAVRQRLSPLMAWHPCPQCQKIDWAPDNGGPLVCLACGSVTE